jgi:hypothetical protein
VTTTPYGAGSRARRDARRSPPSRHAGVAPVVEQCHGKAKVPGSNPGTGSNEGGRVEDPTPDPSG